MHQNAVVMTILARTSTTSNRHAPTRARHVRAVAKAGRAASLARSSNRLSAGPARSHAKASCPIEVAMAAMVREVTR